MKTKRAPRKPQAAAAVGQDTPITVGGNRPRLLKLGAPPPPTQAPPVGDPIGVTPPVGRYWTEERAKQAYAYAWRNAAAYFGPTVKATEFEVEMVGPPLANVLEDWWPIKGGEGSDKRTNLLILAAIMGFFVLMRLPTILAVLREPKPAAATGAPSNTPTVDQTPAPQESNGRQKLRDVMGTGGAYYPGEIKSSGSA